MTETAMGLPLSIPLAAVVSAAGVRTIAGNELCAKMTLEKVSVLYEDFVAVTGVRLPIYANKITAIIGPSGCGKSTLLRSLNRMNDLIPGSRLRGQVLLDGEDIYAPRVDVVDIRRRVGMVFQRPNPFPKSIYDNVAYGLRLYGTLSRPELDKTVEYSLRRAGEVIEFNTTTGIFTKPKDKRTEDYITGRFG